MKKRTRAPDWRAVLRNLTALSSSTRCLEQVLVSVFGVGIANLQPRLVGSECGAV